MTGSRCRCRGVRLFGDKPMTRHRTLREMRAFGVRGLTIYRADCRCSMRLLSAVTARSESSSSEIAKMILESRGRIQSIR
jgi:hypothetical protein